MKSKNKNISVRELFRKKLENAEVSPDPSVRVNLMHKVARREFLRFNTGRFNAYYLGGIIIAGLAGALFFNSSGNNGVQETVIDNRKQLPEIAESVAVDTISIPVYKPFYSSVISDSSESAGRVVNSVNRSKEISAKNQTDMTPGNSVIKGTRVGSSILEKNLYTETSAEDRKLRSSILNTDALFEPSVQAGCPPLKVRFKAATWVADSCRWTFGDGGVSSDRNPEWIFDLEGDHNVVLQSFEKDGTIKSASTVITVYQKPSARFEISPEKPVIPDDIIKFYNYSANAVLFKWSFGDGNTSDLVEPSHRYFEYNKYDVQLIASSEHGCTDSVTIINAFSGSAYFIDFPNAFIPNAEGQPGGYYSSKSDEAAQVFHPVCSGVADYQLKVFSKLGILIFETNDIEIGWDGYLNGQLCEPGVYIWKVRGSFRNGEPFIKMGDLTLIKN